MEEEDTFVPTPENVLKEIEATILSIGGITKDIKYLDREQLKQIGHMLATKGITERFYSPAFLVHPINTLEGIRDRFDYVLEQIANPELGPKWPIEPVKMESKIVELIQLPPATIEHTRKAIDALGFDLVSANYFLGLGADHPEIHKKYGKIICLDEKSCADPEAISKTVREFLCFKSTERRLTSQEYNIHDILHPGWWHPVIRKK